MTTIEILPEITSEQTIYRAISGQQQATGATPGQALDQIEQVLSAQEEPPRGETLVILQRFRPDNLFGTATSTTRGVDGAISSIRRYE